MLVRNKQPYNKNFSNKLIVQQHNNIAFTPYLAKTSWRAYSVWISKLPMAYQDGP